MCQPGLPGPQGESQAGSPGFAAFHRAKSMGLSFCSLTSMRAPAIRSSRGWWESFPYSLNLVVR